MAAEKRHGEKLPSKKSSWTSYMYQMDLELSRKMGICATKDSSRWRSVAILLEISGHGVPWLAGSVFGLLALSGGDQNFACNLFAALLLDLVVVAFLKLLIRRQRPVYNEMDMFATVSVDNYSFPSGHASRAAMLAGLFGIFLPSFASRVVIFLWAACLAVSRVVLGRHHVTDVICGVLIGWLQYLVMTSVWLSEEACACSRDFVLGHVWSLPQ